MAMMGTPEWKSGRFCSNHYQCQMMTWFRVLIVVVLVLLAIYMYVVIDHSGHLSRLARVGGQFEEESEKRSVLSTPDDTDRRLIIIIMAMMGTPEWKCGRFCSNHYQCQMMTWFRVLIVVVLVLLAIYMYVVIDHSGHLSRLARVGGQFEEESEKRSVLSTPDDTGEKIRMSTQDEAKKFVLLTYMRSGSTFVGELFNQYPGAFYHFEPVRSIITSLNGRIYNTSRDNLTTEHSNNYHDYSEVYAEAVQNMLNCDHDKLPAAFFLDPFISLKKKRYLSNSDYLKCAQEKPQTGYDCRWPHIQGRKDCLVLYTERIAPCIPLMQDVCRAAPIRAVKTIRFWMGLMDTLLSFDPSIKVVHLIRDPRAIIYSRSVTFGSLASADQIKNAKHLCRLMLREIKMRKELEVQYPNSFFELRYEDVVRNTTLAVRNLYDFIGLEVPDHLNSWVYNSTHAQSWSEDRDKFGTSRRNASKLIDKWRNGLEASTPKSMSMHQPCVELFKYANYPLV